MTPKKPGGSGLFVRSFTIREIIENPGVFDQYSDPEGYTSSHRGEELQLVAENPWAREDDLTLILVIDEDKIVGRLGLYAGPVHYNGRNERVQWLSGYFMIASYRPTGAGAWLILPVLSLREPLLASGGPSKELQALYRRAGFVELGPLKRFVYFCNARVVVKKYIANPFLQRLLGAWSEALFTLYYAARAPFSSPAMDYRPVKRFDGKMDRLFDLEPRNHFPRSAEGTNWVMNRRTLSGFEIYRNEAFIGFLLLKVSRLPGGGPHKLPDMTIGALLDYYVIEETPEIKRDLVLFSVRFFRDAGVDVFECQACDANIEKACRNLGMVHIGGNKTFFRPGHQQKVSNANWFITLACSDVILGS